MSTASSRKELSHERIVEVASRAVRRAGYRGVGVADTMKEAGLTHGGFYAHFASRDALLVEAMQRAGRDNRAALAAAIEHLVARGHSRFGALVTSYLHDSQLGTAEGGCVVAALGSEMPRQEDAVREEARHCIAELVKLVRAAMPTASDRSQAEVVLATMVGALQLARTLSGQAGRELLASTRDALIERYDRAPGA